MGLAAAARVTCAARAAGPADYPITILAAWLQIVFVHMISDTFGFLIGDC
jgi:hypothetical protein